MSVLIRGMEMPTNCRKCMISQPDGCGWICPIIESKPIVDGRVNSRHPHCPLALVPAHGRLIDADARVNVQIYNDEFEDYQTVNMSIDDLLDSSWIELEDDPTIIPAE